MSETKRRSVSCRVVSRKRQGVEVYEGLLDMKGAATTKLRQDRTEETSYASSKAVVQAAKAFGKRWGLDVNIIEPGSSQAKKPASPRQAGKPSTRKSRQDDTTAPAESAPEQAEQPCGL